MDAVTAMTLDKGRKNNQLLIQPQYSPMSTAEEIAILYCGTHGLLAEVPLESVHEFQNNFLQTIRSSYKETILDILGAGKLTEEVEKLIKDVAQNTAELFINK